MTLTLGFSPCPNDCFIFDAIVNHRIDLEVQVAIVSAVALAVLAWEYAATPERLSTANATGD